MKFSWQVSRSRVNVTLVSLIASTFMARPADPGIQLRLREQAVDYVMTHGIGALALRPLARALKTNARMLIYHFGSREGLMREILAGLRAREAGRVEQWLKSA